MTIRNLTLIALLATVVLLSGCAAAEPYERQAVAKAQDVTDDLTDKATWYLCEAMTLGAYQRNIAINPEMQEGHALLCGARQPSGWVAPEIVQ